MKEQRRIVSNYIAILTMIAFIPIVTIGPSILIGVVVGLAALKKISRGIIPKYPAPYKSPHKHAEFAAFSP